LIYRGRLGVRKGGFQFSENSLTRVRKRTDRREVLRKSVHGRSCDPYEIGAFWVPWEKEPGPEGRFGLGKLGRGEKNVLCRADARHRERPKRGTTTSRPGVPALLGFLLDNKKRIRKADTVDRRNMLKRDTKGG